MVDNSKLLRRTFLAGAGAGGTEDADADHDRVDTERHADPLAGLQEVEATLQQRAHRLELRQQIGLELEQPRVVEVALEHAGEQRQQPRQEHARGHRLRDQARDPRR